MVPSLVAENLKREESSLEFGGARPLLDDVTHVTIAKTTKHADEPPSNCTRTGFTRGAMETGKMYINYRYKKHFTTYTILLGKIYAMLPNKKVPSSFFFFFFLNSFLHPSSKRQFTFPSVLTTAQCFRTWKLVSLCTTLMPTT